jgi:exopolysaccharide biosynthesis protein
MSEKNMDLDEILNEFKDYAPLRSQRSQPAAPRRERQPEPQVSTPETREPVREEPQPEPEMRQTAGREAEARKPLRRERVAREPVHWELPRWFPAAISAVLVLLSCLCLSWILNNVHPGSGTVVSTKPGANLFRRADLQPGESLTPDPTVDPENPDPEDPAETAAPTKIRYIIEEGAVVAPDPNPDCFGKISINEPEKVLEIIQKARDYGLLGEDETVAFDPNVTFYYDEDIEYYLDETILVICWKEVIDGNTCSFAEVKIADASQFRRKFADNTFASANQYYSSELHKSTNAVVSMNADFYQNRDFGVVVYDRTLYRFPTSTYTGNFKKYNCLETCFVNSEGDFLFTELGQSFTEEELKQYIADNDILFSMSFGPVLVRDGQVRQCEWYPVGEIDRGYSRAGIGQVDKLHYLYMSLNHSPEATARWSVNEFAKHFGEKPVVNAYCLDGGQTGELVFQGRAYNHVDWGNERPVSDNIYFATAIGGTEVSE